jgi:hypothetical protein
MMLHKFHIDWYSPERKEVMSLRSSAPMGVRRGSGVECRCMCDARLCAVMRRVMSDGRRGARKVWVTLGG